MELSLSMYGYTMILTEDDVIFKKEGHDTGNGILSMKRHTFEKFKKFYEDNIIDEEKLFEMEQQLDIPYKDRVYVQKIYRHTK